jgi:hypothetical protein
MSRVTIRKDNEPSGGATVALAERDQVVSVVDDEGNVQSQVRLSELLTPRKPLEIVEGLPPTAVQLPEQLPAWAMDLSTHAETMQRTAVYRCLHCDGEHEEYRQDPRALPYAKVCGAAIDQADGSLSKCTAPALRRVTWPGEGVALNACRFEQLSIYERADYSLNDLARGLSKYYIPGRNNEPTEPGMRRIDITNIQQYNSVVKEINTHETALMRARREQHRLYFDEQREKVRDDVDARFSQSSRYFPLRRLMRKRSDQKSAVRYGKGLDAHFHAQLIEFNQGNIQDFCAEDTGWKGRRAK